MFSRQKLCIVSLWIFCWTFYKSKASLVTIERNRYDGIVVALSPYFNLTADDPVTIIEQFQNMISKSSQDLFAATDQKAYFGNVTFLIPKSWSLQEGWNKTLEVFTNIEKPGREVFQYADIFIEPEGGAFGDGPFTLQHEGCGKLGHHIQLTGNFLKSINNNQHPDFGDTGKTFVHEWAHYRYGVFDEYGFPNDPLYPMYYGIPGRGEPLATDCANTEVQYDKKNKAGSFCTPVIDISTGRAQENNCFFVSRQQGTENNGVMSSLMSQHFLPQVTHFCSGTTSYKHNVDAPTKHNALCHEKSTYGIILGNQDFANGSNLPEIIYPPPTVFNYVQEENLRIIIAFDCSSNMNYLNRFNILISTLKRLLGDFPFGSEVGMVCFKETANVVNEMTIIDPSAEEKLFQKFPDRPSDNTEACVECGVEKSLELFSANNQSTAGSIIMLVTAGNLTENETQVLKENLIAASVRLFIMLYHMSGNISSSFLNLAHSTMGKLVYVREEKPDSTLSLVNQINLYEAFQHVLQGHSWESLILPVTILKNIVNGSSNALSINIPVDRTLGQDLKVQISFKIIDYPTIVKDSIILTSPTNINFTSKSPYFKVGVDDLYIFHIPEAEEGLWHLEGNISGEEKHPTVIYVTARHKTGEKPLTLKASLNSDVHEFDPAQIPPPIIFAHVQHGNNPVVGANVIATIYHPNGQKDSFELLDNGIGDPDITKGDGVYSRYLTTISTAGHYTLTISANSNNGTAKVLHGGSSGVMPKNPNLLSYCCGSFVPEDGALPTGKFMRQMNYGSFYVTSDKTGDIYPPNRISDFRVIQVDNTNKRVKLKWTSPGNDYDSGQASSYVLKYFDDRLDAKNKFNNENTGKLVDIWDTNGEPLNPKICGTEQDVLLNLRDINQDKTLYFGIYAIDEAKNNGSVSNIVSAFFNSNPLPSTVNSTPSTNVTTSISSTVWMNNDEKGLSTGTIAIIVSVIIVLLVIIFVILVVVYLRKRKNEDGNDKFPNPTINRIENKLSHNSEKEVTDKSYIPVESLISPVNSWSADVLLNSYNRSREKQVGRAPVPDKDVLEASSLSSYPSRVSSQYDTPSDFESKPFGNIYQKPISKRQNSPSESSSLQSFRPVQSNYFTKV
ncbi:calcium-activated chloride channel regulator 1-like [Tachypleus tridentatus]|uniref:calcium-activated chloride channel regulator 1-like n=1 Tax=Tachypleus tridentatus TaxID=6853 RepID=UPI003FD483A3